jgi:hypothetical protein
MEDHKPGGAFVKAGCFPRVMQSENRIKKKGRRKMKKGARIPFVVVIVKG